MKKSLIIILTILILVTGCGQKEDNKKEQGVMNNNTNQQENSKSDTNSNIEEEPVKKEDSSTNQSDTDKKENSTTTNIKLGENEYISLKDNKVHKYTFTYPDEATCIKLGDGEPYDVLYPKKPYVLFGCEQVKDANGKILWGEYFMEHADENSIFYY